MRQIIPDKLSKNAVVYIVTGHGAVRKYLHSVTRPAEEFGTPKITLAPVKSLARPFHCVQLARDFCRFLHRYENAWDFELAMET